MLRSQRQIGCSSLTSVPISTRAGIFIAGFSGEGLAVLYFPDNSPAALTSGAKPIPQWFDLTEAALKAALSGELPDELPPLDTSAGTDFQQRVWAALRRIPMGETRTYGEIAREIGSPAATRAVGSACGANPIPVLIPCHRVLASGGRLGGFSAGLHWKRHLLSIESALTQERFAFCK